MQLSVFTAIVSSILGQSHRQRQAVITLSNDFYCTMFKKFLVRENEILDTGRQQVLQPAGQPVST